MAQPLSIRNVSARYGATTVLRDLSLEVAEGELVSLLGASGCGKTTTLRLVAGFLEPSEGQIRLGARDLTRLPAHRRDIGLVFQNYALFPHLDVASNVAYGLKQRGVAKHDRDKRTTAMLERVGLSAFAARMPAALSGGQKQRVALARALVIEPPLLMFDEPLSNLDAKLRVDMRVEIRALQRANGTTALYVTHDQEEAFSISDRVAIMQGGRILQLDRPEVLYSRPVDSFVARFVGFENLVPMTVGERREREVVARTADGGTLHLDPERLGPIPDRFVLATRPEGLGVETGEGPGLPAELGLRTYLGRAYQYQCGTAAGPLLANGPLDRPLEPGTRARLVPRLEQCAVLPAEAGT